MSVGTTRLNLTKPGGGSTNLILPPEPVDIDVLNANFDRIDDAIGFRVVTSSTHPTAPYDGQPILETDTHLIKVYRQTGDQWDDPISAAVSGLGTPAGVIVATAAATADGVEWLLCDGASYTTAARADLFAAIGYQFGGSGANFNVPNLKGRVVVGIDAAQTEFDVRGETGGAKTHTLTVAEMPSHGHTMRMDINGYPGGASSSAFFGDNVPSHPGYPGVVENAGGGAAHNNLQPYMALNYIIKT